MRVLAIGDPESVGREFGPQLRQALLHMGLEPLDIGLTQLASWRRVWDEADVFVLVLPAGIERGLRTLEEMARENDGRRRIVVVGPADGKLVLRTLRSGASYYVDQNELEPELEDTLRLLRDEADHANRSGRVIAVLSPSGGSGASTLAVNLAASLAQEHGQAGLLDLKLGAGVLDALLDITPQYHLGDFCRLAESMERQNFEKMLAPHTSGVRLLAAPVSRADQAFVTADGVRQAIARARTSFAHVVVDVDRTAGEEQIAALREADLIVVVLRLDFASIRNAHQTLRALEELEVDPERIRLVANRHGQPRELPREKAEQALGARFYHLVPDEPRPVHDAHHDGVPLVLGQAKTKIARSLVDLAKNVAIWETAGQRADSPSASGWLGRLTQAVVPFAPAEGRGRSELLRIA